MTETTQFDRYFLVMLKKGPRWSPEATDEVKHNQKLHLANIRRLTLEGKMIIAGPFVSNNHHFRGLFLFQANNAAEIEGWLDSDVVIQNGRLEYDIFEWMVEGGALDALIAARDARIAALGSDDTD